MGDVSTGHRDKWEVAESITKMLSAVAIPIVLAIVGFSFQRKLQSETVQRDYVTLSVAILQEPDIQKASPELKFWAAELLNQNSPTKLPPKLLQSLQSGSATLPPIRSSATYPGAVGSIGITPDNIRRGKTAEIQWNSFNATRVTITPGIGKVSLSGSLSVTPSQTTTYTIQFSNSFSESSASCTVVVRP